MNEELYQCGRYTFNITNIKEVQVRHRPEELYKVLPPEEDLVIDECSIADGLGDGVNILLGVYCKKYFLYKDEYKLLFTVGDYHQQMTKIDSSDHKVLYLMAYHSTDPEVLKALSRCKTYTHVRECCIDRINGKNPEWFILLNPNR